MSRFCTKKRREAAGEFKDEQIFETSVLFCFLFFVCFVFGWGGVVFFLFLL